MDAQDVAQVLAETIKTALRDVPAEAMESPGWTDRVTRRLPMSSAKSDIIATGHDIAAEIARAGRSALRFHPIPLPCGVEFRARALHEGVIVRVSSHYDMATDADVIRADVAFS